ncbi:hypothetical protein GIB67_022828 [Kingdonia uniflora]|uniref:Uncharacterized protein n=1 Tax=Kingdonia uniflora TaxID=39325 RepID=A0A7J7P6S7_9MAGN|nr:hypothetical protein GIB67_022828 [Kingdonia uniflora]
MDRKVDKLVRRTTMIATLTASYFLLTSDYGPQPSILDPIKTKIQSAERSLKEFIFGASKESEKQDSGKHEPNLTKEEP